MDTTGNPTLQSPGSRDIDITSTSNWISEHWTSPEASSTAQEIFASKVYDLDILTQDDMKLASDLQLEEYRRVEEPLMDVGDSNGNIEKLFFGRTNRLSDLPILYRSTSSPPTGLKFHY